MEHLRHGRSRIGRLPRLLYLWTDLPLGLQIQLLHP
jgi:hypothetical protein